MTLLKTEHLTFSYRLPGREIPILKNLNLTIEAGEFVAIRGPSGSGKSTLFYLLGCMQRPTAGRILLHGRDFARLSDEGGAQVRNQHIGFVFQQFFLLPRASVLENIALPSAFPLEQARGRGNLNKARELGEKLGLGPYLEHLPHQISGGQQQRVAIARALMNDVDLILADEPTGNLDSANSEQILRILRGLHAQGKTVVMITHDEQIAGQCDRIIHLKDGEIVQDERKFPGRQDSRGVTAPKNTRFHSSWSRLLLNCMRPALENLNRNRAKSALTMVGVVIGIASVLSMVSLGQFARKKFTESFEAMGVNKLQFHGYPNWELKASEQIGTPFIGFDWGRDLVPLLRLFPQIQYLSPLLMHFGQTEFISGGKSSKSEARLFGVNEDYLYITNGELTVGKNFSRYNVESADPVCIIGPDVEAEMFPSGAVGKMLSFVLDQKSSGTCKVLGVKKSQKSNNNEWSKPNSQVLVPFTYMGRVVPNEWSGRIMTTTMKIRSGAEVVNVGEAIKMLFERKYGKAGKFMVDSDSTMIAQSKKSLNVFAVLLSSIAFISLIVGGIGIHNLMLVSVNDRLKEIGLRKALGATSRSIQLQILLESIFLCVVAGAIGLVFGFGATEGILYMASQFFKEIGFAWILDPVAVVVAIGAMCTVGILSGMVPARKARKLQIIEALRVD